MLDLLSDGERTVTEIARPFRISQPGVSQHLRVLRQAGLVQATRDGRERRYRLNAEGLRDVYDWVAHYERFWSGKLEGLRRYLEKTHGQDHS